MDSKLPIISSQKPKMAHLKNILPNDKKQSDTTVFGDKSVSGSVSTINMLSTKQPLNRNLTKLMIRIRERYRTISSQPQSDLTVMNRHNLRRCRSACDILDMPPIKGIDTAFILAAKKPGKMLHSKTVSTNAGIALNELGVTPTPINPNVVHKREPIERSEITSDTATKKPEERNISATISALNLAQLAVKKMSLHMFEANLHDLLKKQIDLKIKSENIEHIMKEYKKSQAEQIASRNGHDCLQRQVKSNGMKMSTLSETLEIISNELAALKAEREKLELDQKNLTLELHELRRMSTAFTQINRENIFLKEQIFQSNFERKKLHNKLMDVHGNIRVFCRVRPAIAGESKKMQCKWNYIDDTTVEVQKNDMQMRHKNASYVFKFDYVFHSGSQQEDIFEMVSPLIQSALDGYNISIIAYGQTGSGKTYTMNGTPTQLGVIPRTVDLLFDGVENYKRLGWEYEIRVAFLEIYNEVLYDLLSNEQKDMEIRMQRNNKNDIYVTNITEEVVETASELRHLIEIANMNRATAATNSNERSSRSHAITKIVLSGKHIEKNAISVGSISFVDLAGSESPKTSTRMNETKNINRSLSELTNVILALVQKNAHIPYRNSKLTHFLMPSLGGDAKTLMFINVSPFQECFAESVKALRFAMSVNACKLEKPKRNRSRRLPNTTMP